MNCHLLKSLRVALGMGRNTLLAVTCLLIAGCGYGAAPPLVRGQAAPAARTAASLGPLTLKVAAAGDVACGSPVSSSGCRGADTANQIEGLHPNLVLALGDLVYDSGSLAQFKSGYQPTWGRFKSITFPIPGNHEYGTASAGGYRTWWGPSVLTAGKTWHSTRRGGWLVLGLDSNCGAVGGCTANSEQGRWLANQLKSAPKCTIAIWHHPRRSSGPHGDNAVVQPLWAMLAKAKAEVVLNGHDHDYERFATLDANANPASTGMREFVVGTGGKTFYPVGAPKPGSRVTVQGLAGVLSLELHSGGYMWKFLTTDGKVRDSGSAACS